MTRERENLTRLAARTRDVYEKQGLRFDAERSKGLHERNWLDRFLALLPGGGSILDLGCGAGEPIAGYFLQRGFAVTGLDFSQPLLDLAQQRYPDAEWICGDMRTLQLERRFDGIIGWNSFFHLTRDQQRDLLPKLAAHLAPGGVLMLTVGPDDGEVDGKVGDEVVYHASLAPAEYREILAGLGLDIGDFVIEDPECAGQTVLLANRHLRGTGARLGTYTCM